MIIEKYKPSKLQSPNVLNIIIDIGKAFNDISRKVYPELKSSDDPFLEMTYISDDIHDAFKKAFQSFYQVLHCRNNSHDFDLLKCKDLEISIENEDQIYEKIIYVMYKKLEPLFDHKFEELRKSNFDKKCKTFEKEFQIAFDHLKKSKKYKFTPVK